MVEAQHADQKIQQLVAELVVERSWSLDQALHEVTNIRADLLQFFYNPDRKLSSLSHGLQTANIHTKGNHPRRALARKARRRVEGKEERKEKAKTHGLQRCK